MKSDSAKSAEIMPAACEKKSASPAKPACNCDDDLSPEPLYRVQVGAYRNKNNADRMLNSLLIEGFPAFIIYEMTIIKFRSVLSDSFPTPLKWSRSCVNSDTTHILYTHKYTLLH